MIMPQIYYGIFPYGLDYLKLSLTSGFSENICYVYRWISHSMVHSFTRAEFTAWSIRHQQLQWNISSSWTQTTRPTLHAEFLLDAEREGIRNHRRVEREKAINPKYEDTESIHRKCELILRKKEEYYRLWRHIRKLYLSLTLA